MAGTYFWRAQRFINAYNTYQPAAPNVTSTYLLDTRPTVRDREGAVAMADLHG